MLHAVKLDHPRGVRDRAILELFYSSALRREELIRLDLDGGLVRVERGKDAKDRIVPMGRHALEWLRRYLHGARPRLASTASPVPLVFLSRRGNPLDGPSVRDIAFAAGVLSTRRLTMNPK